jgi:CDP-diacylglycerol--glycerol-3-phosphate 3-phosphatidyltransferase
VTAPKLRPLRQEITDLPNLVTLGRIALIPLVVMTIDDYSPAWSAISCLVFLIAALTDAALVGHERVAPWLVIALMARELAVTTLRAIASQEGFVIAAGAGGKTKTALQLVGTSFLLVHFDYELLLFDYTLDFHEIGTYLLYLSLVMSVLSAAEYIRFFVAAAARQAEELARQGITRQLLRERMRRRRSKLRALRRAKRADKRAARRKPPPEAP